MFPSKGVVDYMGETNRLLTSIRMDVDPSLNTFNFPFQTPIANRSSSSTDTSPDSYFSTPVLYELHNPQTRPVSPRRLYESRPVYDRTVHSATHLFESGVNYKNLQCNTSLSSFDRNLPSHSQVFDPRQCDTPFRARRQRPIVGRNIYGSQSGLFVNNPNEARSDIASENIPQMNMISNLRSESQYELFPSNERSFEFLSPIKKTDITPNNTVSHTVSPTSSVSNVSLVSSSTLCHSSSISTQSTASLAWQNRIQSCIPEFKIPFNPASCEGSSRDEIKPPKMCMFCRKNGERPTVYMTHCVKEKIGNTFRVTCPILRSLVCLHCGASGDEAHTITYCPILKSINNGKPLKSTTITLKNTRIKSNGRRRY